MSATGTHGWPYGTLGPLLVEPRIQYVKGYYQRPIVEGGVLREGGGGPGHRAGRRARSSTCSTRTCRAFIQPLAGEYAGRRSPARDAPVLHRLRPSKIGHLIDIAERSGLEALGQVDLERRLHRNQELEGLSRMSFVIIQAVMKRLEERGAPGSSPRSALR